MSGTMHFNANLATDSFRFENITHLRDMLRCRFFAKSYNFRDGAISARLSDGTLMPLGAVELDA